MLGASVVIAVVAWLFAQQSTLILAQQRFAQQSENLVSLLQARMRHYEDALSSGAAALQLQPAEMNVNQWQRFTRILNIEKKYPGISGIGVIHYIEPEQRERYLSQQRVLRPDFTIETDQKRANSAGQPEAIWPVTFIEPVAKNSGVIGLDLSREPLRLKAAQQARQTGKVQVTAPLTLVQDSLQTPGFMMFVPFYRDDQFRGLVYAPFIVRKLIAGTIGVENRDIAMRISDGNTVLYDELNPEFEGFDPSPTFSRELSFSLNGRQWYVEFQSLSRFQEEESSLLAQLIVLGAVLIDVLLVYMLFRLDRAKHRFESAYSSLRDTHLSFINSSGDGYFDWLIQGNYEYMSPRFWQILGFEPDEKPHVPISWQELVYQDDLKVSLQNLDAHIRTKGGFVYEQELRFTHKEGHVVTALRRGKVIEWDGDKPVRMIGTLTDITELKNQSRELEKALAFQQLLLRVNTDLIFVKNERYELVQANPAFMNLYPEDMQDKIIGYTTVEEYDNEQAEAFLSEDIKAFAEGMSEVVETIDFPDGLNRSLLTKKIRFADSEGNAFILGIARDITDIKRAESALKHAYRELEEFAYRTSNDLRSPLISSQKMLGAIQEELQSGKINKAIQYAGTVKESMDMLHNRVGDILKLARFNDKQEPPTSIDFPLILQVNLSKLDGMENAERLSFKKHFGHRQNMTQSLANVELILENLLTNAIKYQDTHKDESFVKITTMNDDKWFVFEIEDNGIGIPKEAQPKLFAMFKRFHPTVAFGSGIGLYMVKKAALKMHGDITYEHLEQGSRFVVRLPLNSIE